MVTAELAAGLPVLVLLILTGVGAVQVADARVRCLDAAREVARAGARGDSHAVALGQAELSVPGHIAVLTTATTVTAVVSITTHPLSSHLPSVVITERATAALEPGAGQ